MRRQAFYVPDKTALFEDLVGETAKSFKAAQDVYFVFALSTQHLHEFVAFMYDHFDEFKLILCRAEGTGYADFIEVLVELESIDPKNTTPSSEKTVCSPGA